MASGFRLIELETLTTDDEILPGGFSSSLDPGDPAPPTRHSSILWPYRLFYLFVCTSGICSTSGPDISSIFRLEFLLEWKSVITFFFFYKLHFIVYDNKIFKYFSYHNVDIYLFPIFLVTNKKKYSKKQIQIQRKSAITVSNFDQIYLETTDVSLPTVTKTFHISPTYKKEEGVFKEYSMRRGNSSDKSSPSLPLCPPSALSNLCALSAVFSARGKSRRDIIFLEAERFFASHETASYNLCTLRPRS